MGRIGRGWKLAKVSLGVVKKDKEILILPILSGILSTLVFGLIFIPGFLGSSLLFESEEASSYFVYFTYFLAYIAMTFVIVYFNAAVIGCASIRLGGGDPKLKDGFRIANKKLHLIFFWAILSATMGLIFRALRNRLRFLGTMFEWAWGIITYFVVPIMLFEKVSVKESIGRSKDIISKTWGEALFGEIGMGLYFLLLGIIGLAFPLVGFIFFATWGLIVGLIAFLVYVIVLMVIYSAADGVLKAALYRYARTGQISEDFPKKLVQPQHYRY